jgi:choline kinase
MKHHSGLVGMCDFDRPLTVDDMKIARNPQNQITAIGKKLTAFDGGYIGVTYCGKDMLDRYKETVLEVIQRSEGKGVVEEVLGAFISKGVFPSIGDTSGIRWLEVDTPEDLAIATSKIQSL